MSSTAPFDIGSLIEVTPGVYGGRPCLAGTRFPILQLAADLNVGLTPQEIVEEHPELDLARVHAGIAYYLANKAAIDTELEEEHRRYETARAGDHSGRSRSSR